MIISAANSVWLTPLDSGRRLPAGVQQLHWTTGQGGEPPGGETLNLMSPWSTRCALPANSCVFCDPPEPLPEVAALISFLCARFNVVVWVSSGKMPLAELEQGFVDSSFSRFAVELPAAAVAVGDEVVAFGRREVRPLLAHVHLHKTGGQSVDRVLTSALGPAFLVDDALAISGVTAWNDILWQRPELSAFSSHSLQRAYPRIVGGRKILYFTVLRQPLAQIISYVRYIKENYSDLPEVTRKFHLPPDTLKLTLVQLYEALGTVSYYPYTLGYISPSNFFVGTVDAKQTAAVLGGFTLVGVTEHLDFSLQLLRRKLRPYGLDLPEMECPRLNASESAGAEVEEFTQYINDGAAAILESSPNLRHDYELYLTALGHLAQEAERLLGVDSAEPIRATRRRESKRYQELRAKKRPVKPPAVPPAQPVASGESEIELVLRNRLALALKRAAANEKWARETEELLAQQRVVAEECQRLADRAEILAGGRANKPPTPAQEEPQRRSS